jgi:hypothetical protein
MTDATLDPVENEEMVIAIIACQYAHSTREDGNCQDTRVCFLCYQSGFNLVAIITCPLCMNSKFEDPGYESCYLRHKVCLIQPWIILSMTPPSLQTSEDNIIGATKRHLSVTDLSQDEIRVKQLSRSLFFTPCNCSQRNAITQNGSDTDQAPMVHVSRYVPEKGRDSKR